MSEGIIDRLLSIGLVVVGGYFLYRFAEKKVDEKHVADSDKKASDDPAVGQAQRLADAMNPSGISILKRTDGTDVNAIMDVAKEITNLQHVIDEYKARNSGASLLADLEKELSADDYKRFLALAGGANNTKTNYSVVKTGIPAGQAVITNKPANARSTPKKTGWFDHSNILKTFDPNYVVGLTTGKTEYDEDNDIIFIEVTFWNTKNQTVRFWVAKSQVDLVPKDTYEKRKINGEKFQFSHLDGINTPELVTRLSTIIYDERFRPLTRLRDRVILGFPDAYIKLAERYYVRFRTLEGRYRWVKAADVMLWLPKENKMINKQVP